MGVAHQESNAATAAPRTVVIGASAGGIEPLRSLLGALPGGLGAAIGVVVHVHATGGHALPGILNRAGPLTAAPAVDGESLREGRVYVAPADRHMIFMSDHVRLSSGPRQNGLRPAVDPLFTSAALMNGPNTLGVILSGTLDDGAAGCAAVETRGGTVVVQDPAESAYDSMPNAALAATRRATSLPVADIAGYIKEHSASPLGSIDMPADSELEREIHMLLGHRTEPPGKPSGLSCPQCGGPLNHDGNNTPPRYECRVGHAWSPQSLLKSQSGAVETALWVAVLRLDERGRLMQRLASAASERGHGVSAAQFEAAAGESLDASGVLRALLDRAGPTPEDRNPQAAPGASRRRPT